MEFWGPLLSSISQYDIPLISFVDISVSFFLYLIAAGQPFTQEEVIHPLQKTGIWCHVIGLRHTNITRKFAQTGLNH